MIIAELLDRQHIVNLIMLWITLCSHPTHPSMGAVIVVWHKTTAPPNEVGVDGSLQEKCRSIVLLLGGLSFLERSICHFHCIWERKWWCVNVKIMNLLASAIDNCVLSSKTSVVLRHMEMSGMRNMSVEELCILQLAQLCKSNMCSLPFS